MKKMKPHHIYRKAAELKSDYKELCLVALPYKGRQLYAHTFDLANPIMPIGYEDYLSVVQALTRKAGAFSGQAHMTVDEKMIQPGMSQRRPKPHVDGCFTPAKRDWSHGGGSGWLHNCNNIALEKIDRMSVIVAASEVGCRAWRGNFRGEPRSDGDLSHLDLGEGQILLPNVGYLFTPDCIHESMIQKETIQRTFLRIALPVEFAKDPKNLAWARGELNE